MEALRRRLDDLESSIDVDAGNKSVVATIDTLNNHLNAFINENPNLKKLFNNLNNSKIRFYYDENLQNIDPQELEIRKQFVLANLERIEKLANNLIILQNLEKHELQVEHVSILNKSDDILKNFNHLQKLELKYNELLIRSINLLQNFLNLNDNITKYYKQQRQHKVMN